jgi:hypothetical protein
MPMNGKLVIVVAILVVAVLVAILVGGCDLHGSIDCAPNPGPC